MSWFIRPDSAAYKYYAILIRITEPFIYPFRKLLSRFQTPGVPIDIAPLVTMLAIWVVQAALSWIYNAIIGMLALW